MLQNSKCFMIPDTMTLDEIHAQVAEVGHFREEPPKSRNRIFFDSFDWRLYHAGLLLEEESVERERWLCCYELESGRLIDRLRPEDDPRFTWDFAESPFQKRLVPILEMRALLPQVQVRTETRLLRLLNHDDKTVLRLAIEEHSVRPSKGVAYQPLSRQLRLLPVRGYLKAPARMDKILTAAGLELEPPHLLTKALAALGRQAGDYSSKLNFKLNPVERSDTVARQISLQLLRTLELNVPGTRADLDSEFLHDLRVAVRRTRSALSRFKGVFPEADVDFFKDGFSWIGCITGPTRDIDVYLLGFESYRQSLPESCRADLEPLHHYLQAHHKIEQQMLARKLNSPHFRKLLKNWREFLEAPPAEQEELPNAAKPIDLLANQQIYRMYRLALKEGLAIGPDSPPEALHDLRKSCKKLRYLMEFFQSLYPKQEIRAQIKVLKQLLDTLGDFQDLEVQADKLREFARDMVQEGKAPSDTLLAMGMLVDRLLQRQQQARQAFANSFAPLVTEERQRAFGALFADGKVKLRTV